MKNSIYLVGAAVAAVSMASCIKKNTEAGTLNGKTGDANQTQQQYPKTIPVRQGVVVNDAYNDTTLAECKAHEASAKVIDISTVSVNNDASNLSIEIKVNGPITGLNVDEKERSAREYYCYIDTTVGKPGYVPFDDAITKDDSAEIKAIKSNGHDSRYIEQNQDYKPDAGINPWTNFYADYLIYSKYNDLKNNEEQFPEVHRFHECKPGGGTLGDCRGSQASIAGIRPEQVGASVVLNDSKDKIQFTIPLSQLGLGDLPAGEAKQIAIGCVTHIKFNDGAQCEDDSLDWTKDAADYANHASTGTKNVISFSIVK